MCILYFRRSSQAKKPSRPPNFRSGTPSLSAASARPFSSRTGTSTGNAVVGGQGQQLLQLVGVGRGVPRGDRPVAQRLARVGHHQFHVDVDHVAEAFARGTGAQRAVEAVQPRLGRRVLEPQSSQASGAEADAPPAADRRSMLRRCPRVRVGESRPASAGFARSEPCIAAVPWRTRSPASRGSRARSAARRQPIDHHVQARCCRRPDAAAAAAAAPARSTMRPPTIARTKPSSCSAAVSRDRCRWPAPTPRETRSCSRACRQLAASCSAALCGVSRLTSRPQP